MKLAAVVTGIFPVTNLAPVPEKVGCDTLPVGVPLTVISSSVPVKLAEVVTAMFPVCNLAPVPAKAALVVTAIFPVCNLAPVPVNVGADD